MDINYTRIIIFLTLIEISIEKCYEAGGCIPNTDRNYGSGECYDEDENTYEMHCYMVNHKLESSHTYQIHTIKIYSSDIQGIKPELFNNFINVKSIYMVGDNITKIDPEAFSNLPHLKYLNLTDNNISYLPMDIFNRLETLILTNNKISLIKKNVLTDRNVLQTLVFSHNNIFDVSPLLENCGPLLSLDISYNYINKIEFTANCSILVALHATRNNISSFSANTTLSMRLQILDLSWNNLTYIELKQFPALTELDLGNNPLFLTNDLPVDMFQNKGNLLFLNLSSTRIRTLSVGTFSKMTSLTRLDLSYNSISSLPKGLFHDLINLSELYLNNNLLAHLDCGGLGKLQKISLDNNLWNCDILSDLIAKLRSSKMDVITGLTHNSGNIFGISCFSTNDRKNYTISINTTEAHLNQLEKEYYSFMNKIEEDFQNILLRQENLSNLSTIYQQNKSDIFWTDLNRNYLNFSKTVLDDIKEIVHRMTNTTSSLEKLFNNSDTSVYKIHNDTLTHLLLLQERYVNILRKDRETFLEKTLSKFQGVLMEVSNALNQTMVYMKKNFSAPQFFPKEIKMDKSRTASLKYSSEKSDQKDNYKPITVGIYCVFLILIGIFTVMLAMYLKTYKQHNFTNEESNPLSNLQI